MKSLAVALIAVSLGGHAPIQCASEPDDSTRRYEEPGEGLYALAEEFKKSGDEAAYRSTLEFVVKRYPNSRFAVRAKQDLAR